MSIRPLHNIITVVSAICLCLAFTAQAGFAPPLSRYMLVRGPISVAGVEDDLSGIACHPESGALYAIRNSPTVILRLNADLQVDHVTPLTDFDDTEDLCHVSGNRFAVVEERRRMLCTFELPAEGAVSYRDVLKSLIEKEDFENKGLEGVTYISDSDRFIIVKEKKPMRIYSIAQNALGMDNPDITHPWDAVEQSHALGDLSAVHYDATRGHLLLLSDESKSITEVTLEGNKVSTLSLTGGHAGLQGDIAQPEGITIGKNGHLYIVSEPNLIYEFAIE